MFLDASAVVAILLDEPEASGFIKAIEAAKGEIRASPVVRLAAAEELARRRQQARRDSAATAEDFSDADELVTALFEALSVREMLITSAMSKDALRAMSIYGAVVGHPARLDLCDALSYACAKAFHVPLLYIGDRFSHTDLG